MIKKRSIPLALLFSVITLGIYYLYWFICITNDTNKLAKTKTAGGVMAIVWTVLTCGIYRWYWAYMLGKKLGEIEGDGSQGFLHLLLHFIFLDFISRIIAQKTLNEAADGIAAQANREVSDVATSQSHGEAQRSLNDEAQKTHTSNLPAATTNAETNRQPDPPYVSVGNAPQAAKVRPMRWYKFLIYFALFAGALINLVGAILSFTGGMYFGYSEDIYEAFPFLKTSDIVMGVALVALSVLCIWTRFALAKFKRYAPTLIDLIYSTNIAMTIYMYIIMLYMEWKALGGFEITTTFIELIFCSIFEFAIQIANMVYFNKRKDLFCN